MGERRDRQQNVETPSSEPVGLALDVAVEAEAQDDDAAFVQRVLARAVEMQRADLPPGAMRVYLSVVLTDDAGIAELNRQFRGIDAPTDVLSFPQLDPSGPAAPLPEGEPLPLGDVVVSLPRAEEQAREYGHSRERELGFLLVHGLLHLLGYDHETPDEAAAMEERQDAVLDALGLTRDAAGPPARTEP